MGFNDFHQHKYKIIRLSKEGPEGKEISSQLVVGSRNAIAAQEELEVQGLPCSVFNITKGVEEHRTGVSDSDE